MARAKGARVVGPTAPHEQQLCVWSMPLVMGVHDLLRKPATLANSKTQVWQGELAVPLLSAYGSR
jgi:hypothetical protein